MTDAPVAEEIAPTDSRGTPGGVSGTGGVAPSRDLERSDAGPVGARLEIAFFTDTFEPTHDGVARVTATLASALRRRGHGVTVFTVRSPGLPRREVRPDGVRVHRSLSVAAPGYPEYRVALGPWLLPFSRARSFDVVHLHTPGLVGLAGWLAARAWRRPTVATYHTNLTDLLRGAGRRGPTDWFFRAWSRFSVDLCDLADLATAPTESARASLKGAARHEAGRRARVVPNGVDTERFRPGIADPDWSRRLALDDAPRILFLGRLTHDKGVERFLEALGRLDRSRPWVGLVGGEGPLAAGVRERLRPGTPDGARVRFLGPVPEAEKPALLGQSQVFVLPSLSDTSSVALLEAMASGLPAVVTTFGGPAEIARESSAGLLVDPRDPARLARAIATLLEDPRLAREHGARGRDWVVAHASADRMAEAFLDGYRAVALAPVTTRPVAVSSAETATRSS